AGPKPAAFDGHEPGRGYVHPNGGAEDVQHTAAADGAAESLTAGRDKLAAAAVDIDGVARTAGEHAHPAAAADGLKIGETAGLDDLPAAASDCLAAGGAEEVLLAAAADHLPREHGAARGDDLQSQHMRRGKTAGQHGLGAAGADRPPTLEPAGRDDLTAAAG